MNNRFIGVEDHPAMRLAIRSLPAQDPQFEIVGAADDGNAGRPRGIRVNAGSPLSHGNP